MRRISWSLCIWYFDLSLKFWASFCNHRAFIFAFEIVLYCFWGWFMSSTVLSSLMIGLFEAC